MEPAIVSPHCAAIEISYLTTVYYNPRLTRWELHQSQIDDVEAYPSFAEFAAGFWTAMTFPRRQTNKFETYSWVPVLFEFSDRVTASEGLVHGLWRKGEHSNHHVTVLYLDMDNDREGYPTVTLDELETTLRALGVSHMLYTSFSHTPEKHKVRAILPISRTMTYDEAFEVWQWFNAATGNQLDGSIYDDGDHLFGPPHAGVTRQWLGGQSVDVDAVLALAKELPDAVRLLRSAKTSGQVRLLRPKPPAELAAQVMDSTVRLGTTIKDTRIFNPDWGQLVTQRYQGGSHRQTLLGILGKVWRKTSGRLSFGEMQSVQTEIDHTFYGGYCLQKYGRDALSVDIRSVMRA